MPKAYSYIRFSSEKQSLGRSLERQLGLAREYAKKHDLILDDHSYRDLGVSAFKGKNAYEGRLGTFIQAVDDGIIQPGSYLLVESLDRISRAEVDIALELFLSIIRRGIIIVTLADNGALYSSEKIKSDKGMSLIMSILVMIRANEESATKSQRVKDSWADKAAKGIIMSKVCPGWIKYVDGKFELKHVETEIVRTMFHMYTVEGRGSPYIAGHLNKVLKVKPFGWAHEWTNGTVASILNHPAAYGTLRRKKANQPSIPNYYPAAIDEATFLAANAAATKRHWVGGKKGVNVANLFGGMSFCFKCGGTMRVVSSRKNFVSLRCTSSYNKGKCDAKPISSHIYEKTILDHFIMFQWRDPFHYEDMEVKDPTIQMKAELLEIQAKIKSMVKLAELTGDVDAIAVSINALQAKSNRLQRKIKDTHVVPPPSHRERLSAVETYKKMRAGLVPEDEVGALRTRLQAGIRRLIDGVIFRDDGSVTVLYSSLTLRTWKIEEVERYRENGTFAKRKVEFDAIDTGSLLLPVAKPNPKLFEPDPD